MSNPFITELVGQIDRRFNVDSADMTLGDWICANTTIGGRPFNFDRYPFQKKIADDLHPNMDVIKPSQVGLSEIQIRKALAFGARQRGTTSIFTMPNEKMYKRMSLTRIKPIIDADKAFNLETANGERPVRSMGLYQIGTSFMFVTGMTEGDATSISADAVFNDEIDISDQQMLALFNSRLQNSDWKINHRFSTPTFTNFGVDKGYLASNQFEYMCRCPACNHWNIPTFTPAFVHIPGMSADLNSLDEIDLEMVDRGMDLKAAYVKCERCAGPLPLGQTEYREWVPRYQSRTHHHGYRVSPFSTDRLSIEYIVTQLLRYKSRDYLRGWYNTVLGVAYTDSNSRLSDADIEACFTSSASVPPVDPTRPTWIGGDIGQTCHMVVAQGEDVDNMEVVRFNTVPASGLLDWVAEICGTYNVVGGAVDRHPYTPTAEAARDQTEGRILPVEYRGTKPVHLVRDEITDQLTHAQANRTRAADAVARAIRRKELRFSGYADQRATIIEHLKDMVRDENPEKEATWVKLTGNDHYFHALIFLLLAVELRGAERALTGAQRGSLIMSSAQIHMGGGSLIGNKKNPYKVSPSGLIQGI